MEYNLIVKYKTEGVVVMARGVKREKSVRLSEELKRTNYLLEKNLEAGKELQAKKKELEREIELCAKKSILDLVEQSGLSTDELKDAINSYCEQVDPELNENQNIA
jgi:uncharacterized protein YicC (UPF0701 family)